MGLLLGAASPAWGQAGDQVTNPYVLRLASFWTVERFFVDGSSPVELKPVLQQMVLAKAEPDECYAGIGEPYPDLIDGRCEDGVPKVNQAYVWGLAKQGDFLYFGTVANTHCLVLDGFLGIGTPMENPYWVCEFGQAIAGYHDWRPPKIYRYDLSTSGAEPEDLSAAAGPLLGATTGIRSAGALDGVVFLAGPSQFGGVNMFAFRADTGQLLGAKVFAQYSDIRSWLVVGGVLYTTVGQYVGAAGAPGGKVLRWRGELTSDPAQLFDFEEVGDLDAPGAYLALHDGRIYITTWPSEGAGADDFRPFGLYRGPIVPSGGLSAADHAAWKKIWAITDYDLDPIAARVTAGGALASHRGTLFWGTMHVPFFAAAIALQMHQVGAIDLDSDRDGQLDTAEALATALGTHRSITLFQAVHPEKDNLNAQIVYGEYFLPRYDPVAKSYRVAFDQAHVNGMKKAPKFGPAGLGNFWNTYLWTMLSFRGSLYFGTFEWSQLARVGIEDALGLPVRMDQPTHPVLEQLLGPKIPIEGADLFRIETPSGRARAESLDGLGNFTNYGLRTMISDGEKMWIGTANPMNLHPLGGWELIEAWDPRVLPPCATMPTK